MKSAAEFGRAGPGPRRARGTRVIHRNNLQIVVDGRGRSLCDCASVLPTGRCVRAVGRVGTSTFCLCDDALSSNNVADERASKFLDATTRPEWPTSRAFRLVVAAAATSRLPASRRSKHRCVSQLTVHAPHLSLRTLCARVAAACPVLTVWLPRHACAADRLCRRT